MYRHLSHAPSRSLSGHVCLSCRRQFNATTRQRKDEQADDWLANFNDLSTESETKSWHRDQTRRSRLLQADKQNVPDRSQVEAKSEAKSDVDSEPKPEATSFESLRAKLNYATRGLRFGLGRRVQEPKLDDTSSQALEGIPKKVEAGDHVDQPVRQEYESVLADLMAEQGRGQEKSTLAELVTTQDNSAAAKEVNDGVSKSFQFGGPPIRRIMDAAPVKPLKSDSGIPSIVDKPLVRYNVFRAPDSADFANSPGELADQQARQEAATAMARSTAMARDSGSFHGRLAFKELRKKIDGSDDKASIARANQGEIAVQQLDKLREHQATDRAENVHEGGQEETERVVESSAPKPKPKARRSAAVLVARKLRAEQHRQARAAKSEHSISESQAPDNNNRTLSDVMVGRELAQAMRSNDEARPSSEKVDDSGLPRINAKDLRITPLNIEQPSVPGLSHGLDKVLFNPGVMSLQDQHSRVYNFDPYLQHIMPVEEFDFNALQQYKTSSQDSALSELAKQFEKKYVGSTSSMTSTLSHFHYLLSGWRDLNLGMLSRQFPDKLLTFTAINRAPTAIFLRWKNGTYAIDADKEHDSGNILMMLGKSMEKLLTLSKSDYERYRKSDPRQISEEERNLPEAYEYTAMGDFLMRSQLDAYDPRLPGTGMFDIKTRAVSSIRMSTSDYKPMLGYEILTQQGKWESYEREYYEMMRSTMLKYMLQARMGRMDGIFLAYHNVQRMFGFQYMPIAELDRAIHGQIDRCLGDQEFKFSIDLLNKVLDEATTRFPEKSLRLHFETRTSPVTAMYIFAEPMEEEQIDKIQATSKGKIEDFERKMMGIEAEEKPAAVEPSQPSAPIAPAGDSFHMPLYAATILVGSTVNGERVERPESLKPDDDWSIEYLLKEIENPADAWATYAQCKATRAKVLSRVVETGDEDGGGDPFEAAEPNLEMHESDGSVRTFDDYYREMLRQLAEKGREYRRRVDEVEEGVEKVVFREKVPEVEVVSTQNDDAVVESSEDSSINSVDDYMTWMYGPPDKVKESSAAGEGNNDPEESKIRSVDDYMHWMFNRVW
jgi:Uri superfamily endonuclease